MSDAAPRLNRDRPLDAVGSIKVKLALLVIASIVAAAVVSALGRRAGVPSLVSVPVTMVAALAVTWWLARGMTAPLRAMAAAAGSMASGNYRIRVPDTSADEVGQLGRAFNQMATDLATSDEQRRALIATVSHELRTPLAAQRALLENLADGVVAPDERTLGTALAQAERLSDLVRDLLDLSRIQGGAASLDLSAVPLADFLASCVAEAELRSRGVVHEISVTPADLTVRADVGRLAQVVINLVDNADRHSPAGGTVRLSAEQEGDHWVLDVRDQGPGIPAAQRDRLFQRFGSADTSTGGSGLGLAIARWICELHRGRIDAPDSAEGAHLRVRLPMAPAPAPSLTPTARVIETPIDPRVSLAQATPRHTEEKVMPTQSLSPELPTPPRPPVVPAVPVNPPVPPSRPTGDFWGALWPERDSRPQVGILSAAALLGVGAAIVLPWTNGMGIAATLVLALGGSLAFVVSRAWRSPWALAVWALCLVGAALLTVRAEPGLPVLGLILAVPLFMSAFTKARTLFGLLVSAMSWVLAAARGLPLLGRTLGVVSKRRNIWSILRAVAATFLGVLIFGALFASADAIMGSWVSNLIPDWRWDEIIGRGFIWVFVTGLALTAAYVALNPPTVDPTKPLERRPVRHRFEWLLPVGAVIVLFLVFLAAQASALFGGSEHVLKTAGLTYAEYARQGFGQLCVVTALTTVVLALVRFFAPEATDSDRRVKRGTVMALVALALLVVASALHRLWLYQDAYGFTTARVGAALAELWLALVLGLVGAAALGWTWWGAARTAAFAASGLMLLQPLVNMDARVVELNATRYEQTQKVDVAYLQQLAPDGAEAIRANFPADIAACALTGRGASEPRHWASWNLGEVRRQEALVGLEAATVDCLTQYGSTSTMD